MITKLKSLLLSLFLFVSVYAGSPDVMLQGFHWTAHSAGWWQVVDGLAAQIDDDGYTMVWLPPSSDAASDQGYLPRELYNYNSFYGSQAQLQALLNNLNNRGIVPIADIVINHRVGCTGWADYCNPTWPTWYTAADDEWNGPKSGNNDTGERYSAARDLDHHLPQLQGEIVAWLNQLKSMGYRGWRYDLVKGFAPWAVKLYNDQTSPEISIGEFFDGDVGKVENWVNSAQNSTAFDFPLRFALIDAFDNNNYGRLRYDGLINRQPGKAVTFLENHDTEEQRGGEYVAPFPRFHLEAGYAYLLTHPGIPCVFWTHAYPFGGFPDVGDTIRELIQIRKEQGIHSTSQVDVQAADGSKYAAIIDGKVAVKVGWGDWSPAGSDWTVASSGQNYAVWTRCSGDDCVQPGGQTTIRVHYDTGFGNSITIRGNTAPLSWSQGVAANWSAGNVWVYQTDAIPAGATFEFKALINDSRWQGGGNNVGRGGETIDIYPNF